MSYFPRENTYNGFHVTPNYYASSDAAASPTLYRSLAQNTAPAFAPTLNPATSGQYYNQVMSAQQNLYSGWSGFCGQPQGGTQQTQHCHQPNEIHIHRHHIRGADGQMRTVTTRSAADPRQTGGAFGHCGQTTSRSCRPYAFGNFGGFGAQQSGSWNTGSGGQFGSYGGQFGSYGGQSSYGGQLGSYGGQSSYGGQFGNYGGQCGQSSYNYGQSSLSYPGLPQMSYPMAQNSFNYSNDFSSYFNNNNSNPFGTMLNGYDGKDAMKSIKRSSLIGAALSLLF